MNPSPYLYADNSPVSFTDPMGLEPSAGERYVEAKKRVRELQAKLSRARADLERLHGELQHWMAELRKLLAQLSGYKRVVRGVCGAEPWRQDEEKLLAELRKIMRIIAAIKADISKKMAEIRSLEESLARAQSVLEAARNEILGNRGDKKNPRGGTTWPGEGGKGEMEWWRVDGNVSVVDSGNGPDVYTRVDDPDFTFGPDANGEYDMAGDYDAYDNEQGDYAVMDQTTMGTTTIYVYDTGKAPKPGTTAPWNTAPKAHGHDTPGVTEARGTIKSTRTFNY